MDKPVTHFRYVLVPESLETRRVQLEVGLRAHLCVLHADVVARIMAGADESELKGLLGIEPTFPLSSTPLLSTLGTPGSLREACRMQYGIPVLNPCSPEQALSTGHHYFNPQSHNPRTAA